MEVKVENFSSKTDKILSSINIIKKDVDKLHGEISNIGQGQGLTARSVAGQVGIISTNLGTLSEATKKLENQHNDFVKKHSEQHGTSEATDNKISSAITDFKQNVDKLHREISNMGQGQGLDLTFATRIATISANLDKISNAVTRLKNKHNDLQVKNTATQRNLEKNNNAAGQANETAKSFWSTAKKWIIGGGVIIGAIGVGLLCAYAKTKGGGGLPANTTGNELNPSSSPNNSATSNNLINLGLLPGQSNQVNRQVDVTGKPPDVKIGNARITWTLAETKAGAVTEYEGQEDMKEKDPRPYTEDVAKEKGEYNTSSTEPPTDKIEGKKALKPFTKDKAKEKGEYNTSSTEPPTDKIEGKKALKPFTKDKAKEKGEYDTSSTEPPTDKIEEKNIPNAAATTLDNMIDYYYSINMDYFRLKIAKDHSGDQEFKARISELKNQFKKSFADPSFRSEFTSRLNGLGIDDSYPELGDLNFLLSEKLNDDQIREYNARWSSADGKKHALPEIKK